MHERVFARRATLAPLARAPACRAVLTADSLRMAHELALPLPHALAMLRIGGEHGATALKSANDVLISPFALPWPPYIAEWHAADEPCLTRVDWCGVIRYAPNDALLAAWGALGCDANAMAAEQSSGWEEEGKLLEDYWLRAFSSARDQAVLIRAWASAFAQAGHELPAELPAEWRAEARAASTVRIRLNGHELPPCVPRVRVQQLEGGRQVWESVVVPVAAAAAVAAAHLPHEHSPAAAAGEHPAEPELMRLADALPLSELIEICAGAAALD